MRSFAKIKLSELTVISAHTLYMYFNKHKRGTLWAVSMSYSENSPGA